MKRNRSLVLVCAGVLIALNVILTRLVSIPVGQILRITVGQVPVILAGVWFGPVIGGITGAAGDLIGCAVSGYVPNPFISLSAALMGVIPGLFRNYIRSGAGGPRRFARILAVVGPAMLLTSQGFTVLGLHLVYGVPFRAAWVTRLPQTAFLCVINSLLCETILSRVRLPGSLGNAGRSAGIPKSDESRD